MHVGQAETMTLLITGLVTFFIVHSFSMFRTARQGVIDRIGALPYRGLYSVLSLGSFVLLVMGWGDAPRVDIWSPPPLMRPLTMALMFVAMVLLASMYLPGYIKAKTKNPMLLALKTWAFAHLLANGDLASMLLFGSFLVWAVIDLIAVKRSGRSSVVDNPRPVFDIVGVGVGGALWLLIVLWAHPYISGMPLVAP